MKVANLPQELPAPVPDYSNFDYKKEQLREEEHQKALAIHIRKMGYTGKNTGRIARFPMADGYALYMFADAGAKSVLVHLPYGDGYDYPDVRYIPKTEVLRRMNSKWFC